MWVFVMEYFSGIVSPAAQRGGVQNQVASSPAVQCMVHDAPLQNVLKGSQDCQDQHRWAQEGHQEIPTANNAA